MNVNDERPLRLLWLDIETTGVDPRTDRVLEISAWVTGMDAGRVLARFHAICRPYAWESFRQGLSAWADRTHSANGLLAAVDAADPVDAQWVETRRRFDRFVAEQAQEARLRPAGWNVQFDVRWLTRLTPGTMRLLDYRQMDVQSLCALIQDLNRPVGDLIISQAGTTDHRSEHCLTMEVERYRLCRAAILNGPLGSHKEASCTTN
ncbi:hypothetical protein EP30_05365 [Bifidobacterium sp. UTCIF-39]|uniref:exonuclease domain-containing protein n=1 Tax=Bifidobacterium sp. UTCIF-39 TaxID=1465359 RepID=UPI00112613C6|nr:exonuclease domain-containing protein [Bifidobacterium sp. UTCIF-39]TPF96847.1 hypothetical protein EP30_05365 [Bifidobacterium sp. UTCIF-39]